MNEPTLPLDKVFSSFTNGDETGWADERAWLLANHPRRLAAQQLGLLEVPVADAWDGSYWELHANNQGADDPAGTEQ